MSKNTKTSKTAGRIILAAGSIMCLWVGAALVSALSSVGWSISTLAGQYMQAIGMVKPLHTLAQLCGNPSQTPRKPYFPCVFENKYFAQTVT